MRRAPEELRRRICEHCNLQFSVKPCKKGRYCSKACKDSANWKRAKNDPRPCVICSVLFKPSRGHGNARFCSKKCEWVARGGADFSRSVAQNPVGIEGRRLRQLGRGEGKAYRKYYGRHEHRVVAEQMLGRPLRKGEIVHHKDGNHLNNDPSNLAVMTQSEHMREHGLGIPGQIPKGEPWKYRRRKINAVHS